MGWQFCRWFHLHASVSYNIHLPSWLPFIFWSNKKKSFITNGGDKGPLFPTFIFIQSQKVSKVTLNRFMSLSSNAWNINNYVTSHEIFSVSGEKNRGVDFVHENSNKTTKYFLTPEMPTAEMWRQVCQKVTDLSKLKENMLENMKKGSKWYKKYDNKVLTMRYRIRLCQFNKMSPQHSSDIISIDSQQLKTL